MLLLWLIVLLELFMFGPAVVLLCLKKKRFLSRKQSAIFGLNTPRFPFDEFAGILIDPPSETAATSVVVNRSGDPRSHLS